MEGHQGCVWVDAEVTAASGMVSEWRMVLRCVSFFRDVIHRGEAMASTSDIPEREEWRGQIH
jgi:hypothetical protein